MLKKLLLLSFAAFALAACNDEAENDKKYQANNPEFIDGVYSGQPIYFYGTAKVTNTTDGSTYTDPEAWFEFTGDNESNKSLVIYMHQTRFAAAMPALEMRLYRIPYTMNEAASLSYTADSWVPQVRLPNQEGGGYSYQDMPAYTLTQIKGEINDILCQMSFSCDVPRLGSYRVEYEGRLVGKN